MGHSEGGAAGLEFVGVLPVLLLSMLAALQFGVAGWTVVATGEAARDGARALTVGHDPQAAARSALPGSLSPVSQSGSYTPDGYRHTVRVRIPSVLPGVDLPVVVRSAEMPRMG